MVLSQIEEAKEEGGAGRADTDAAVGGNSGTQWCEIERDGGSWQGSTGGKEWE